MPDKKLTDSEIVSTLQKNIRDSERINSSYALLNLNLLKETVDLINRQKEEIESLKAECQAADGYEDALVKRTKSEAHKEFAENFVQKADKTKIIYVADTTIQEQETGWYQISIADFDNLLKELVGDVQ